jgi:hypothetical protein
MWKKWWFWFVVSGVLFCVGLAVTASILARRIEPFVREQTELYLRNRFGADVEIGRLDASLRAGSPLNSLMTGGKGTLVRASGEGIKVRLRGRRDVPPILDIGRFEFDVDMSTLWNGPVDVPRVMLERFHLTIPPKGQRGDMPNLDIESSGSKGGVVIRRILADGARLTILPKDRNKAPLIFDLHQLRLFDAGVDRALRYDAVLTNAKPPGLIDSSGSFGPWDASEPSNTPLSGEYNFKNADLGVFKGIEGTLSSTGKFAGILERITVDGTTVTPDFRLSASGNRVPLRTSFHVVVDATNGNTLLEPVRAQLGSASFECRGGVVRNTEEIGKTVDLDVKLRKGDVADLILLAMKGTKPMLRGAVMLDFKLVLPPGRGEIADRLKLQGRFELENARFTSPTVQEKIDNLSRRGQGRPKDKGVDEVPSTIAGDFLMQQGRIRFSRLRFTVPGSAVELAGRYLFDSEVMDFRGKLRLEARVSETMTGWKRWVLKPVDPFFAKDGAGTVLGIAITGTRSDPQFGLDR